MNNFLMLLVGGLLTIIGGFFANGHQVRVAKKQEIEDMKIGLSDELSEIIDILSKLLETYNSTQMIPNTYLNNLKTLNESFNYHKQRLFIIRSDTLRKDIRAFYKNLNSQISESINTVGSLNDTPDTKSLMDGVRTKCAELKASAEQLKNNIQKYKFKTYYVC